MLFNAYTTAMRPGQQVQLVYVATMGAYELRDISRATEFLEEFLPGKSRWFDGGGIGHWVFRGQADASWPLVPSAFRGGGIREYLPGVPNSRHQPAPGKGHADAEERLVNAFLAVCERSGIPIPEDSQWFRSPELSQALFPVRTQTNPGDGANFPHPLVRSLYALAQHHGIQTRLLDWSESPHVASYFACVEVAKALALGTKLAVDSTRCAVYALRLDDVIESLSASDPSLVRVTAPRDGNVNLRAQTGLFTLVVRMGTTKQVSGRPLPTVNDLVDAIDRERDGQGERVLVQFTLPHSECRLLLRLLADMNVTAATMFPGYPGAVRALEEREFFP